LALLLLSSILRAGRRTRILDLQGATAGLLARRLHFDLKHAVAEGSGGAFRVGTLRQRDAAVEAAIAAFALIIAAVAAGRFMMALALDGDIVRTDFYLDVLMLDFGQISVDQL